jgi:DNA-binding response OmpR family regulator
MTSEAAAAMGAEDQEFASEAVAETKKASIVIIDDDRSLLGLLRMIFLDAAFEVQTYLDARVALDEVTKSPPDAIILDLEMPLMNGRAFFQAAREAGVRTPILILSAYGARNAQQELGAEAFVDKPFEPELLLDKARRLIR